MDFWHVFDLKMTKKFQFSGKKSFFKILPLIIKIKAPAVVVLGTCGLVVRCQTHCTTEI